MHKLCSMMCVKKSVKCSLAFYKPCPVLRMSNPHHSDMVDDLVDLDLYLVPVIGYRILCHEFLHLFFKLKDQGSTDREDRRMKVDKLFYHI